MRSFRTLFGFSLGAVLGVFFAFSAAAFPRDDGLRVYVDDWPTTRMMILAPIDFAIEAVAPYVARALEPAQPDPATVQFNSKNQPGQDWRFAADTYRHIDPGRRISA